MHGLLQRVFVPQKRTVDAAVTAARRNAFRAGLQCTPTTGPRIRDDTERRRGPLQDGDDEIGCVEYDPAGTASILIRHTGARSDRAP